MDLTAVCWFYEVAKQGSFSKAAKKLLQPNTTVSRRIAKLETELGVVLMQRTTRSITLTDEGCELLKLAEKLVRLRSDLNQWQEDLTKTPSGTLRITAPPGFANFPLTPWLISYRQTNPLVKLELVQSNEYLDFQQHQLDAAFRQGPLPDSSLFAKRLFAVQWGVFVSPKVLRQSPPINQPQDLEQVPVIGAGFMHRMLPWRFTEQTWQPKQADLIFEETSQCLQAAKAGLGFTYASHFEASAYLERGELVEVLIEQRATPAVFYLVMPHRLHQSLKLQSFVEHIQMQIQDLVGQLGISE